MAQSRSLVTFALLYFGQGGLSSYISYFQKPYLTSQGVSLGALGVLTMLVSLPFILKVFFGLITDRFSSDRWGGRVPWIAGGIICAAAAFLAAAATRPAAQLSVYITLMAGMVFAIALADTATDAMAVETVPPESQANVQAAMTGSRALGAMVASALVGLLVAQLGYGALMPAMAAIAVLPLPFLVLAPRSTVAPTAAVPIARLLSFFNRSRVAFAVYALIMSLGLSGTMGLVTLFMHSSLGAGSGAIGSYGVLASGGTLAGAALYAALRKRSGVERATLGGQVALAALALVLSAQHSATAVTLLGIGVGTIYGYVLTGVLEMTMGRSDPAFAGTTFALLVSIFNVGGSIGDGLATAAAGKYGFISTFLVLAVISALSILPLVRAHSLHREASGHARAEATQRGEGADR